MDHPYSAPFSLDLALGAGLDQVSAQMTSEINWEKNIYG